MEGRFEMKKITVALLAFLIMAWLPVFGWALTESEYKAKLAAMKPKDFPTKPIEFVVVYPAGGGMDVTARILGKYVEKYIDNRVMIINRAGGAGMIGHTWLATQAPNDGYTVGILSGLTLTDGLTRAKGKWTYRNFEAMNFLNENPQSWIVTTKGRFKDKSLKEILEVAKKNPNTVKVAGGSGTTSQFLVEDVEYAAGVKFIQVPFPGGKDAITSLLGGHLDVSFGYLPEFKGNLEAGQVQVVANAGERDPYLPNVPTFNEILGVDYIWWTAMRYSALPKGAPKDRFKFLESAIDAALHDPGLIKDMDQTGNKVGHKYMNSDAVSKYVDKLFETYVKFLKRTGRELYE